MEISTFFFVFLSRRRSHVVTFMKIKLFVEYIHFSVFFYNMANKFDHPLLIFSPVKIQPYT